jgi:hypothetical protein
MNTGKCTGILRLCRLALILSMADSCRYNRCQP